MARAFGRSDRSVRRYQRRFEDGGLAAPGADPNLSGSPETAEDELLAVSADRDPADRWLDRLFAKLGLLDDAAPLFRDGVHVPRAGVLLALPAIAQSGVVDTAREVYGSIGPAFYGLRTTIVTLVFLALLRIKHPEALKEHAPSDLGRLLGLDRAPEVKTLRRKLTQLAGFGRATEFGRQLAQRRVRDFGDAMGFLYIDGHVRAYHGKRTLPKTHVARMRIAMPATTELRVTFAPLSSPHRTAALAALCADLDALAPRFPGTRLRVRYAAAA